MVCKACTETLHRWKNGKKSLNFEITMVWRRPTNYVTDCYFCSVDFTWINIMNLSSLKYPDLQLARHPIVYYDEILVPIFRQLPDINIVSCFNEQKEEVFLRWSSTSIFPKKIELSSLQPQLVKGISNCWHLDWGKKISDTDRIQLWKKNLYCADFDQLMLKLGVCYTTEDSKSCQRNGSSSPEIWTMVMHHGIYIYLPLLISTI